MDPTPRQNTSEAEFSPFFEGHARHFTSKQNNPWQSIAMVLVVCVLIYGYMSSRSSSLVGRLMIPLGVAAVGVPFCLVDFLKAQRLAKQGVLVNTVVVQANPLLYQPSRSAGGAPALVVFSFDPISRERLEALVEKAHQCHREGGTTPAEKKLGRLLRDETYRQYRRVLIPVELTDGAVVYLADLWIPRKSLAQGYLDANSLTCIATPGARGWLLLIPPLAAG